MWDGQVGPSGPVNRGLGPGTFAVVDKQVAASGDDGYNWPGWTLLLTETADYAGNYGGNQLALFVRCTEVTIAGVVTTSYTKVYGADANGSPVLKVYGVDEDNPAAPTTQGEFEADPLTTAAVDWDGIWTLGDWNQSPSLNDIFNELYGSYTIENDAIMLQVKDDGCGTDNYNSCSTWDWSDHTYAAKLHIEYTAAGVPRHMDYYRRRRIA